MRSSLPVVSVVMMGLLLFSTGCSTQYAEVDAEFESGDVIAMLDEIKKSPSVSSADQAALNEFFAIKDDPKSSIYFSYGPGELGPTISVASLVDWSFLGANNVFFNTIEDVRIFYVMLPNKAALLIDIKVAGSDSFVTRAFVTTETPFFADGEYIAVLGNNGTAKMALRSMDVTDGELNSVIQLKMSLFAPQTGEEIPNGKFSTLVGFGP